MGADRRAVDAAPQIGQLVVIGRGQRRGLVADQFAIAVNSTQSNSAFAGAPTPGKIGP